MSEVWVAAFVGLSSVVALLAFLVLGTLRRLDPLISQLEMAVRTAGRRRGLDVGSTVPSFEARDVWGQRFTDSDIRGASAAVLFLSTSCAACGALVQGLTAGSVPDFDAQLVIVSDNPEEARAFATSANANVLVDQDGLLTRIFESDRTPQAFVLDEDMRVTGIGSPNDWDVLRELIASAGGGGAVGSALDVATMS